MLAQRKTVVSPLLISKPLIYSVMWHSSSVYELRLAVTHASPFPTELQYPEIILCMHATNERRCYNVMSSLIGWAHTQNDPWYQFYLLVFCSSSGCGFNSRPSLEFSPGAPLHKYRLSDIGTQLQYIPRNMHTVFALLCFVVVIHWLIFPYPSGLLHWHCGNLTIAPVPAKQPWWIWINTSCEFIMNDCITTTKQSTTKPCAYFLGYTVYIWDVITHPCLNFNGSWIIVTLKLTHWGRDKMAAISQTTLSIAFSWMKM